MPSCHETHAPLCLRIDGEDHQITGGSCLVPPPSGTNVFIGFDGGMMLAPYTYPWRKDAQGMKAFLFPIHDGNVPSSVVETRNLLDWMFQAMIQDKAQIHIGCIGGHGRTGLIMAALLAYKFNIKDAIQFVREVYCPKAVETHTQISWLVKHFGVSPAEPSKVHYQLQNYNTRWPHDHLDTNQDQYYDSWKPDQGYLDFGKTMAPSSQRAKTKVKLTAKSKKGGNK